MSLKKVWSGRRGSNPRRPAWEAGILPLNYSRSGCLDQVSQNQVLTRKGGRSLMVKADSHLLQFRSSGFNSLSAILIGLAYITETVYVSNHHKMCSREIPAQTLSAALRQRRAMAGSTRYTYFGPHSRPSLYKRSKK